MIDSENVYKLIMSGMIFYRIIFFDRIVAMFSSCHGCYGMVRDVERDLVIYVMLGFKSLCFGYVTLLEISPMLQAI